MKKAFKIIAYGTMGVVGLILCVLAVTIPSVLADKSENNNWLWLYTPHVIAILIFLGWIIYYEIDES